MDFGNPMISLSVKIWTAFGYIYPKDIRRFFTLIPTMILHSLQLSYLFFSDDSLVDVTLSIYFVAVIANCLVTDLS